MFAPGSDVLPVRRTITFLSKLHARDRVRTERDATTTTKRDYPRYMRLLVNVDVPELDRAIAFYTRAIGLTVGRRFDSSFVELLGADAPIYLLVKPTGSDPFRGATQPRTYERHWSPVHLDFVVDDIDAAVARALAAGAIADGPITDHPYGRLAMFADPFGHGFCLLQFVGDGYDVIATESPLP